MVKLTPRFWPCGATRRALDSSALSVASGKSKWARVPDNIAMVNGYLPVAGTALHNLLDAVVLSAAEKSRAVAFGGGTLRPICRIVECPCTR